MNQIPRAGAMELSSMMMRYAHSLADDKIAAVRRLDRSNVLSASTLGL
jgi:hypothetical protein